MAHELGWKNTAMNRTGKGASPLNARFRNHLAAVFKKSRRTSVARGFFTHANQIHSRGLSLARSPNLPLLVRRVGNLAIPTCTCTSCTVSLRSSPYSLL